MKAVIPAAGLGTRFLPAAKAIPKEMLPVGDRPVIHYVVEEAASAGFDEILIVLSRGKEAIPRYFTHDPELERHLIEGGKTAAVESIRRAESLARIHYVYQTRMRGLGDAILLGRQFVGGDDFFAVLLGDTIMHGGSPLPAMAATREQLGLSCVAIEPCPPGRLMRYGIAGGCAEPERADVFRLDAVVEKPDADSAPRLRDRAGRLLPHHAFAARYLFRRELFDYLETATPGHAGEIQLTDAMGVLLRHHGLCGVRWEGKRLDIGNPAGLLEAALLLTGDEAGAAV